MGKVTGKEGIGLWLTNIRAKDVSSAASFSRTVRTPSYARTAERLTTAAAGSKTTDA